MQTNPRKFTLPACRALFGLFLGATAAAQCATLGSDGTNVGGLDGPGGAIGRKVIEWDPDGPGPMSPGFVFGGTFNAAGSSKVGNVAMFDATNGWTGLRSAVGAPRFHGTNGSVIDMAVLPTGQLVIVGEFTQVGDLSPGGTLIAANRVAVFDGVLGTWSTFGSGISNGFVDAVVTLPTGEVVVGGSFTTALGAPGENIARWTGTSWSTFGTGTNGLVAELALDASGNIVVGGQFTQAGGLSVGGLALVVANAFTNPFGTGLTISGFQAFVAAIDLLTNGNLAIGGSFTQANGVTSPNFTQWNGTSFVAFGSGSNVLNGLVYAIDQQPNGELFLAGSFSTFGSTSVEGILTTTPGGVAPLGVGIQTPSSVLASPTSGSCVVTGGGLFAPGISIDFASAAQFNGSSWFSLAPNTGITSFGIFTVSAVASFQGNLFATGQVGFASGNPASGLVQQQAGAWVPVSPGLGAPGSWGKALATINAPARLVVGGDFTVATGGPGDRIATWNGTSWGTLGSGMNGAVNALLPESNGGVIAGGDFTSAFNSAGGVPATNGVARFAAGVWQSMGGGLPGMSVQALARTAANEVIAVGFDVATSNLMVQRFQAGAWSSLVSGITIGQCSGLPQAAVAVLANGNIVVGGAWTDSTSTFHSLAVFNGTTWSSPGGGAEPDSQVTSLVAIPDGGFVAGGLFTNVGTVPARHIVRFGASGYSAIGEGTDFIVFALARRAPQSTFNRDVLVGGEFSTAGSVAAPRVAVLAGTNSTFAFVAPPCHPFAPNPPGLLALGLWLGETTNNPGTVTAGSALALHAFGASALNPPFPLTTLWPMPGNNCTLTASPDAITIFGAPFPPLLNIPIAVPNNPALVGTTWFHQLVAVEAGTGPNGEDVAGSSAAFSVTVGCF